MSIVLSIESLANAINDVGTKSEEMFEGDGKGSVLGSVLGAVLGICCQKYGPDRVRKKIKSFLSDDTFAVQFWNMQRSVYDVAQKKSGITQ